MLISAGDCSCDLQTLSATTPGMPQTNLPPYGGMLVGHLVLSQIIRTKH